MLIRLLAQQWIVLLFTEAPRPAEIDTADVKLPRMSTFSGEDAGTGTASTNVPSSGSGTTTLAGTSQPNAVEQVQITTFQDVEEPAVAITPMAQETSKIATIDDTFTIKQFLQRPVKLTHFQLNAKDGKVVPVNEFSLDGEQPYIFKFNLPGDILAKGGKWDKVANHYYFKADVKVKITLNTNPFVGGRFYLTYSPYEDSITVDRRQVRSTRAGLTAYPGVEIDAQLDNSVEILIPFASYREAYDLTSNENYVALYLYALTPILGTTSGSGVVDMAVFAWFENIELNLPTSKQVAKYNSENIEEEIKKLLKIQASLQIQWEDFVKKPISTIGGVVSPIAKTIGKIGIPIVSEVSSVIGWVSDLVGGVANIFGWSKPNSMKPITAFQNVPGKAYTHVDGIDQSVPLALSSTNELEKPANIFPSALDEMDLAYVCANPAVKHIFDWKVTTTAGEMFTTQPLGLLPVGIGSYVFKNILAEGTCKSEQTTVEYGLDAVYLGLEKKCELFDPYSIPNRFYDSNIHLEGTLGRGVLSTAPCEYISQLFKYWRATICFKISVVKTAFHTGRLEIFFDPGMYSAVGLDPFEFNLDHYSSLDTTNNYKYILDLTNDSEVTIRIPYVSDKLFLKTSGFNSGVSSLSLDEVANTLIGSLIIRPVSNLMAPETVSQVVKVVVWKWAEDVVLSCPISSNGQALQIYSSETKVVCPSVNTRDVPSSVLRDLPVVKAKLQINIGNKAEGNVETFFNTTNIEDNNMLACKIAAGERIVSLRPLLRIFRYFQKSESKNFDIDPQLGFTEIEDMDYISYLSYMYRFFRGGFRYKMIGDGKFMRSQLYDVSSDNGKMTPSHYTTPTLNPFHEVMVPYYSQYRKLPIGSKVNIMRLRYFTDSTATSILRSGNDDLTYGWLMGTPALLTGPATVKWNRIVKDGNAESYSAPSDKVYCPWIPPTPKTVPASLQIDVEPQYTIIPDTSENRERMDRNTFSTLAHLLSFTNVNLSGAATWQTEHRMMLLQASAAAVNAYVSYKNYRDKKQHVRNRARIPLEQVGVDEVDNKNTSV